ncbi:DHH family phosphoesterase [archaeon]|nr:MAG: DHH family phosphoesterase [archaeon]
MAWEETVKPAVEFLGKMKTGSKVAVILGHDDDTVCSAAVIYRLLKKIGMKPSLVVSGQNFTITDDAVARVRKLKPDYIVVLDIADIGIELMDKLKKIGGVLNIDHHNVKPYAGITYVNPRIADAHAYIPVSYLCYRIYAEFLDADDISWIAGIGTLGDHGVTNCLDLFKKVNERYPELIGGKELVDEKLYDGSIIGKLASVVDSARVAVGPKGSMKAVKVLIDAKSYNDVTGNKQLKNWYTQTRLEFRRIVEDFWKNKTERDDIVFYVITSKYNFKSALSGYLQQSFANKIIMIGHKDGDVLDISFRRGAKVNTDLSQLAAKVVKSIPNSTGGGHEAASAVRVPIGKVGELLKILSK